MSLENFQLIELCEIAKEAALQASSIITSQSGSDVQVQEKIGGENIASCVVTEIDLAAQDIILKTLFPSLEKFNLGLLTEESTDDNSRFDKDYFWCIDPLDGTLAFSRNEDGYSTSIALVCADGTPVIGVVFNPRAKAMYSAIKGHGAFKNDCPLTPSIGSKELTLLYDQSFLKHPTYENQIDWLERNLENFGLTSLTHHHLGGAVMNGISTIDMGPAIYYKYPKKALGGGSIWDFAASSIIQSEAGGYNTDFSHRPLHLNNKSSTFMNQFGVIYASNKRLAGIIPDFSDTNVTN